MVGGLLLNGIEDDVESLDCVCGITGICVLV